MLICRARPWTPSKINQRCVSPRAASPVRPRTPFLVNFVVAKYRKRTHPRCLAVRTSTPTFGTRPSLNVGQPLSSPLCFRFTGLFSSPKQQQKKKKKYSKKPPPFFFFFFFFSNSRHNVCLCSSPVIRLHCTSVCALHHISYWTVSLALHSQPARDELPMVFFFFFPFSENKKTKKKKAKKERKSS